MNEGNKKKRMAKIGFKVFKFLFFLNSTQFITTQYIVLKK